MISTTRVDMAAEIFRRVAAFNADIMLFREVHNRQTSGEAESLMVAALRVARDVVIKEPEYIRILPAQINKQLQATMTKEEKLDVYREAVFRDCNYSVYQVHYVEGDNTYRIDIGYDGGSDIERGYLVVTNINVTINYHRNMIIRRFQWPSADMLARQYCGQDSGEILKYVHGEQNYYESTRIVDKKIHRLLVIKSQISGLRYYAHHTIDGVSTSHENIDTKEHLTIKWSRNSRMALTTSRHLSGRIRSISSQLDGDSHGRIRHWAVNRKLISDYHFKHGYQRGACINFTDGVVTYIQYAGKKYIKTYYQCRDGLETRIERPCAKHLGRIPREYWLLMGIKD